MVVSAGWAMLKNWWAAGLTQAIPVGLIIPFMDDGATIPDGWSQYIVSGAPAIKCGPVAAARGGITAVKCATSNGGEHVGGNVAMWVGAAAGSTGDQSTNSAIGRHNHTFTCTYAPALCKHVLIQATDEVYVLPKLAGILADAAVSGLVDKTPDGILAAGIESLTSQVARVVSFGGFSTAPNHMHITGKHSALGTAGYGHLNKSAGAHRHNAASAAVADRIKRFHLGIWAHEHKEISLVPGMYALWESTTPPEGWSVCDGTNGTEDLTDYFIELSSGADLGTKTGDGTITASGSTTNNGAHSHAGTAGNYNSVISTGHHGHQAGHVHSISAQRKSFEPIFYTLIAIKYTG